MLVTAVHQLWPPPGDMRKTEMNILFFQSDARDPDDWKSAWTQRRHPDVCWPEKWLPADLGSDVRVLFASYSESLVDDVVDDLFKALVIRDEWDLCKNHQPLVLVGGGFGTRVLDDFFLKATEEVLTSPTEAGAFVRNVRGVTLYGRRDQSYKIEKFFGGRSEDIFHLYTRGDLSSRRAVFVTQGSMLINPAVYGKNLTRDVVGLDPCQWIREAISEDWDPEVRWKPESKQSRGYILLLESCRMVYQFEAIRAILEHLQQKLDNITTACDISNYSDSMFENEFTYLRRNGIEGAKILIVQRMLATVGVDVEQHMVAKKSDDGEQLENERKLAILKFTVARFFESDEWHMVPKMKESAMRHKVESSLNDVVHGISPLSDDVVNEKMQREREREREERERESYVVYERERERERESLVVKMQRERERVREEREERERESYVVYERERERERESLVMKMQRERERVREEREERERESYVVYDKMQREREREGERESYDVYEKMQRERERERERESEEREREERERERERVRESYLSGREAFRRDGNDTVPIHFPSIREQSIMSVKQLQQLACNMRPGENLPREDVQEQLTAHMEQVLHGGKLIVTANILEGKIQFLFGNAKSMAQIVGVGLDFATVSLTRQNVIVVEGITELEWTRLWGEVFLGESLFENPIFMEKVVFSPPVHEKPQGSHVNALSKVAMFFMIEKFLQNLDVGKVYNQVVRGVATTMTEENQPDIGQVHAKSVNDPSTGILGFNLWDYFSRLQITRGLGSATRDTSGEGGSHVGGTGTPGEGDKDRGGDGREDDDNRKGQGAKGKEIQQNKQRDVLVTVHTGYEHGVWNRNPVPEQLEGSDIDPIPEQLKKSYTTPILTFLFKKTEKQQSNTIVSKIEVSCGMNTSSLDQVNHCSKRFGWCQNHLHVSLQCLGHDAATLCGSSLVGTQDLKDTFMEQTQAPSSQATLGVTGGFHGFASVSASLTKPLASTLQSNQRVTERPSEYISGTGFQPKCHDTGGPTPILRYDFNFRPELPTNMFPDGSDQQKYDGMRCTVYPHFEGIWGLLSQDEACKYEFQVERHVCELVYVAQSPLSLNPKTWGRGKQKLLCNCNKMLQTYKVTLYINHKMSNIETLQEFGTDTLWKGNPKNALIELSVDPSGHGSDEASSSTQ